MLGAITERDLIVVALTLPIGRYFRVEWHWW
jgi:hypothetical protein